MGVVTRELCCAVALALVGCGNEAEPQLQQRCVGPAVSPVENIVPSDANLSWDDTHQQDRRSCNYKKGSKPSESLGSDVPHQTLMKSVKHVIVIMRENRSFDHYLGAYPDDLDRREQHVKLVDSDAKNPDPRHNGEMVGRFPTNQYCSRGGDPDHEWNAAHLAFDNGKLDGFIAASNTNDVNSGGCFAMAYFTRENLPFYYWLADKFAISESYFSSLLGPTMANISFYYNATSCGTTENLSTTVTSAIERRISWGTACPKGNSIVDLLAANGMSMRVYNDSPDLVDSAAASLTDYNPLALRGADRFQEDVEAEVNNPGSLADVVFIEPNYGHAKLLGYQWGTENDEHPPSNILEGQLYVWRILKILFDNPSVFKNTVVFISWDENGGFYDHVVPPTACAPDGQEPADFDFKRYGFRVPFFVVSPFARPNFASSYVADHTSILRFIETWHDLPALTDRDANAWPLLDMFDFDNPQDAASFKDKFNDGHPPAHPPCDAGDTK